MTARLDTIAARVMSRVAGRLVAIVPGRDLGIVRADGTMRIVAGPDVPYVLFALGLGDMLGEIESGRAARGRDWLPSIVIVEEMATVVWTETRPLARGGAA